MPRDGVTVRGRTKSPIRSPVSFHGKRGQECLKGQANVTLEVVLGVTSIGNSSLALDPSSGLVAYPAGCVVVLLNPDENRQQHIINTSRKTFTALSFSPDGKYLVTGESGHLAAVRLWAVSELRQVAELQTHKYGVSCVAFSPNGKYIVSVGNQHNMVVHVWAWKKDALEAAYTVSCEVTGVSFSEDSSYFVTVGDRHVKFWYLDPCKSNKCGAPVPLLGRPGLLAELKNHCFSAVACGRGSHSHWTFCITSSGLLCQINKRRVLEKWQDLRTPAAHSLCVAEDLVFCGGSDGTVQIFSVTDLSFVCTLPHPHPHHHPHPHPHPPPSDTSAPSQSSPASSSRGGASPAVVALACDSGSVHVGAVFSDHSVCVWDLQDGVGRVDTPQCVSVWDLQDGVGRVDTPQCVSVWDLQDGVGRVDTLQSAAYHSSCVWDLQMFPDALCQSGLSWGTFLSCSADNTIRMWRMSRPPLRSTNLLTIDLVHTLHVDKSPVVLVDSESTSSLNTERSSEELGADNRTGIRSICVSPDGEHLASGDCIGVLRVFELSSMEQILKMDAHDSEILCLEYSRPDTGLRLLATASRERLIHILDSDYSLLQTLDDLSSSITALSFTAHRDRMWLISCGADKSISFHCAHWSASPQSEGTVQFLRSHHTVTRNTLCDISVDPSGRLVAVAGQDHCFRIFDISTGKQKKVYKGSQSGNVSLLKIQMDPSGSYVATSCSDKTISLFDLRTGECMATMSGHSEVATGLKFTNDCTPLISASGDSCVFVWRLKPELTLRMRQRQRQLQEGPGEEGPRKEGPREEGPRKKGPREEALLWTHTRRELYRAPSLGGISSESDGEDATEDSTVSSSDSSHTDDDTGGSDKGQDWDLPKAWAAVPEQRKSPRRRWSHRKGSLGSLGSLEIMVKSMLDLRQLHTFEHKKSHSSFFHCRDRRSLSSLLTSGTSDSAPPPPFCVDDKSSVPRSWLSHEVLTFPEDSESDEIRSPDSACSMGYNSREATPDSPLDKVDSLHQDSLEEEEEEEEEQLITVSSVEAALRTVTEDFTGDCIHDPHTPIHSSSTTAPSFVSRPSLSSHFLGRGQYRHAPVSLKPPVSKVCPLMEDSCLDTSPSVKCFFRTDRGGAQKRRSAGHLWRRFPSKTPLDTTASLHKSEHSLVSVPALSPVLCSERTQISKRPQHLCLDPPSTSSISQHLCLDPPSTSSISQHLCLDPPSTSSISQHLCLDPPSTSSISQHLCLDPPSTSSISQHLCLDPPSTSSISQHLCLDPPPTSSISQHLCLDPPSTSSISQHLCLDPSSTSSISQHLCLDPSSTSSISQHLCLDPSSTSSISPLPWDSSLGIPLSSLNATASSTSRRRCSGPAGEGPQLQTPPRSANFSRTGGSHLNVDLTASSLQLSKVTLSRIPQLKQPLSPQRSLTPKSSGFHPCADPDPGPASTSASGRNKPASRQRSVELLPLKLKRSSVCEEDVSWSGLCSGVKGSEKEAVAGERPLVDEQSAVTSADSEKEESVTVETCRRVVCELQDCVRRSVRAYSAVAGADLTEEQLQIKSLLSDAFASLKCELHSLPPPDPQGEALPVGGGAEDKTLVLLEQYAQLLLQSVEKKMDTQT